MTEPKDYLTRTEIVMAAFPEVSGWMAELIDRDGGRTRSVDGLSRVGLGQRHDGKLLGSEAG